MTAFLDCLCDENYEALIIEGEAPDTELREAWIFLLGEYYELRGDMDGLEEWRLSRDITKLQNHLFLVGLMVQVLEKQYSQSVADSLNKLGYFFFPEDKTPGKYINELNEVVNYSKTRYTELKQLIKQQEERAGKIDAEYKRPKRDYFDSLLIEIEEMQHSQYSLDTMPVAKFIQLEKKYWKIVERLNEKANNGKY